MTGKAIGVLEGGWWWLGASHPPPNLPPGRGEVGWEARRFLPAQE